MEDSRWRSFDHKSQKKKKLYTRFKPVTTWTTKRPKRASWRWRWRLLCVASQVGAARPVVPSTQVPLYDRSSRWIGPLKKDLTSTDFYFLCLRCKWTFCSLGTGRQQQVNDCVFFSLSVFLLRQCRSHMQVQHTPPVAFRRKERLHTKI